MVIQKEYGDSATDSLTKKVIGCAIEVHRALGPGLLETIYEQCLARELADAGLKARVQVPIPVEYKGMLLDCAYRADILVDDQLIVELKAVDHILSIHEAQLITYMKLAQIPAGLILNFNVKYLKDGIRRLFPSPRISA